jgi:hypothetical protein
MFSLNPESARAFHSTSPGWNLRAAVFAPEVRWTRCKSTLRNDLLTEAVVAFDQYGAFREN